MDESQRQRLCDLIRGLRRDYTQLQITASVWDLIDYLIPPPIDTDAVRALLREEDLPLRP
jgi:hypothetical protein